jgi:hypothetical protein
LLTIFEKFNTFEEVMMYHIYIDGVHLYLTVKHIILHGIVHLQIHITREGSSGFLPKTFGKPSCQVFCLRKPDWGSHQ